MPLQTEKLSITMKLKVAKSVDGNSAGVSSGSRVRVSWDGSSERMIGRTLLTLRPSLRRNIAGTVGLGTMTRSGNKGSGLHMFVTGPRSLCIVSISCVVTY